MLVHPKQVNRQVSSRPSEQPNQASLTESLNQFKTNHENTIVIISMRLFWTLWILCVLLFCERVGSEKRITALDQDQENQVHTVNPRLEVDLVLF